MENYIEDFEVYVKYLSNEIEGTTTALSDQNKIELKNFDYYVYSNYGEYLENKAVIRDETKVEIPVCIRADSGAYDPSASVDTYIQSVSVEVLAPMDYKNDFINIFNTIAITNAKKLTTIDDYKVLVLISELPEISQEDSTVYADEKFVITFNVDFIFLGDMAFSDDYQVYINGVQLPVKVWYVASNDNPQPDNQYGYSDNKARFMGKFTAWVFKIEFIHLLNNAASKLLFKNALDNSYFNQIFSIELKYGEETVYQLDSLHASSSITAQSGSAISMSTEFYPYSTSAVLAGD